MNIFQRLFPVAKDIKSIVVPDRNEFLKNKQLQAFNIGTGNFDLNKAELISTVYTCISILASNMSRLPVVIYNENGNNKTINKQHYYYSSLRYQPQSIYSYQNWMSLVVAQLFFMGNSYGIINGKELLLVNPDDVSISIVGGNMWYLIEGFEKPFRHSEILHFKLLSKDGVYGLNPIQSLKSEINLQYKSEKTTDTLFTNNTFSTKYFEVDFETALSTTKAKKDEYLEKIQGELAGYSNAGQMLVVPPMYRLKELKINPSDLNFLEIAGYTESSIAALFGIPIFLLGKSNSNYTNFEQQTLNFKNQVLGSICNIIRCELEAKLLSIQERINGATIEFDFKPLMDTDMTTRANVAKTLNNMGALSPNEVRKEFNLERIDNPEMDKYYAQVQYQPLGTPANNFNTTTNNNETQSN
ncbi:phage portal protein [Ohtaekwangia koreensis]|uniref:Phage portal protein, HK97 family n=1 Tax=Ohtaekwangia koreensis TaxID=688867 RepID=A0A1T5JQ66_9BACT|nr:phage portal protein [Ohtaekwangia koreensis]SKC53552.1 phage portal protein, HK97 family [Ohtaekwangia koreensis]